MTEPYDKPSYPAVTNEYIGAVPEQRNRFAVFICHTDNLLHFLRILGIKEKICRTADPKRRMKAHGGIGKEPRGIKFSVTGTHEFLVHQ